MARKKKEIKLPTGDDPRLSNLTGRPHAFESPEKLVDEAKNYIEYCITSQRVPNKAGLAFFLGVSRDTIHRYGKDMGEGFSDAIRSIYAFIEDEWVQNLARANAAGSIFYLKNAFGYMDAFDHTSGGKPVQYVIPNEISNKHRVVLDIKKEPEPIKDNAPESLTPTEAASV